MKARINRNLLSTTLFDSGALSFMAMVIHQFEKPGRYRAVVMNEGRELGTLFLDVNDESPAMQIDIDLATVAKPASAESHPCDCPAGKGSALSMAPGGYALFYASERGKYHVSIYDEANETVFDSTRLTAGDSFAMSLLQPGTYSMMNELGTAKGTLRVRLTEADVKRLKNLEPQYIDVDEREFSASEVELVSSQGLVFRAKGASRVRVERTDAPRDEKQKAQQNQEPVVRWRKSDSTKAVG